METMRSAPDAPAELFAGAGEMRARCREMNWAATPLGAVEQWPPSLRTATAIVLGSGFPMILVWGPELVQIYNDAYASLIGRHHPRALGMPTHACWPDIRRVQEPIFARVFRGETVTIVEAHYRLDRAGAVEDAYFDASFVPVPLGGGGIGGSLSTLFEVTERAAARRLAGERERLTADAERAERRAARLLEQVSDAHITMDREFRIVHANPAAERVVGVTRAALVGRTHWELWPASVGAEPERQYRRVQAEGLEAHFTHRYVGEGHDAHLEIDAYPTDEGGVAVFWRDVSSRVLAEQAQRDLNAELGAERSLLRTVLDQLPVAVVIAEVPSGRVLAVNEAVSRVWGERRPRTATIERYSAEWVGYHTDGRRVASDEWPLARAVRHGETVSDWICEVERADGGRVLIEVSAAPAPDPEGRVSAAVAVVSDITVRVRAERERERLLRELRVERARIADVFRQAPAFLAVVRGPEHVFELVNDAYSQLVGDRVQIGLPVLEALPEVRDQGFIELLDGVLATGEPVVGREVPLLLARTPGAPPEERYVDFIYQPLVEADGTRSGVVVHGSDVTEQVRSRHEVERLLAESERARADAEAARAEAEAASRAKSDFLAVMSHELRTPLNAIGGYAEIMEMGIRGPISPAQREDLARIQTSQRHLLGLINEVLNYTKLETGMVRYDLGDVRVREALTAAENLVAPQARAKGLTLGIAGAPAELAVRADAEKLRQILVNLLSNAVSSPTGAGGSSSRARPATP
ncbi:MAG TPA: PAS domain-containing protein [Gemmatimonadaceae bacterium]|nr:PAS domain-containing protein [Gemmatimonadaceae bacterium]